MEKLKNIPSLRFPEFEGNWEVCKLGEVMNFKVTNSFSRENLNYEIGDVKNIHYGDIHTKFQTLFDITKETVPFINEEISLVRISKDYYCKEGDIIFADASEGIIDVGKSIEIKNLNGEKLLSGLHTLLARPIENKFMIGFNGYLFKSNSVRLQIQKESQGSKVLSINVGRISGINLSFPSIQEQTKIASLLTAVEDKLQALKQKKTLLEQYKKGGMQKIFSQELRFKDDNGNKYPDWEEKKLGDLCNYKNGGSFENFVSNEGSYNLISLNSIDINGKLKKQHKKVTITDNSLQKGDLIMVLSDVAHGNFLGLTDIIPNDEFVLNQRMAALKPKTDFNSFYLKTFINFNQSYFKLMGQGSSQLNLSKGDVENFLVKLPIFEEQTKIADFLSAIDDKIIHCQSQIEKTEVWKKGLLQQLFV